MVSRGTHTHHTFPHRVHIRKLIFICSQKSPVLKIKLLASGLCASGTNSVFAFSCIILIYQANQMWCLGLHLPLIVGNLVPEDDEHWQHYCTLLQIVRIIFSPVINREQIPYLQVLIQEFLEKFKDLYPQCSIIPKMHYMVHMPRTMLQ